MQQSKFKSGLLNPNYTGNFLVDIQYGCGGYAGEEDSDDQEFDYNRDQFTGSYTSREHRHLPSTIKNIDNEALNRFQLNEDDYELLQNNTLSKISNKYDNDYNNDDDNDEDTGLTDSSIQNLY